MAILKCSEFFSRLDNKPFLLGALYSRIVSLNNNEYFATTATFKSSKYIWDDEFNLNEYKNQYLNVINNLSGYKNWFLKSKEKNNLKHIDLPRADYIFLLQNDMGLTTTTFFRHLQSLIYRSSWITDEGLTDCKKQFVRGFMELRGSIDTNRPYISQDYFYNNKSEIKKALLLFDMLEIPTHVANVNFRELQKQFVNGENKRNPQFRMELNWYAYNIGFYNEYKALIFKKRYYFSGQYVSKDGAMIFNAPQRTPQETNTFTHYLNFFSNNVYGQDLSKQQIADIRNRLGFSNEEFAKTNRNKKIIAIYKELSPDKCAICGTEKTYINKSTGRNHFEIHHMISYKNGQNLDVIDNLVKLCPTCHDMMGKNSGMIKDQLAAIKKILSENDNIFEFCSNYLNIDDIELMSQKICDLLG